MRRISSKTTFYFKRIFPVFWFGFFALFMIAPLVAPLLGGSTSGPPIGIVLVPAGMMIFGYFLMRKLVSDLADEVWDAGNMLVIKNGHQEERVALSDIMHVSYSQFVNPPRVTLYLRIPSMFGDRVSFSPPVSFLSLWTNPIAEDLIKRVDAARRGGPVSRPNP
jgi:hypothetical protein